MIRWSLPLVAALALLVPGASRACEEHAKAAAAKRAQASRPVQAPDAMAPAAQPAPVKAVPGAARGVDPERSPRTELREGAAPELHADKCSCSSAADCTCKKGKCDCKKCQKPRRQVVETLKGRRESPVAPQGARVDAGAGLGV